MRSQNSICTHLKPKPAHIPWPFHKKTPTILKKATRVTFTIIITAEWLCSTIVTTILLIVTQLCSKRWLLLLAQRASSREIRTSISRHLKTVSTISTLSLFWIQTWATQPVKAWKHLLSTVTVRNRLNFRKNISHKSHNLCCFRLCLRRL